METTHVVTRKTGLRRVGGWLTALFALVMGCAALLTIIQNPAAIPMAALFAVSAIAVRVGYRWTKEAKTETASTEEATVGSIGLVIASIAVAPLILFALLWTSLLLIIGGAWLLHLVGLA